MLLVATVIFIPLLAASSLLMPPIIGRRGFDTREVLVITFVLPFIVVGELLLPWWPGALVFSAITLTIASLLFGAFKWRLWPLLALGLLGLAGLWLLLVRFAWGLPGA